MTQKCNISLQCDNKLSNFQLNTIYGQNRSNFVVSVCCAAIWILCHTYLRGTACELNLFTPKLCFFGKYDSHHCVCKQENEGAVVKDVMSVRVLLEARILSTSGHTVAFDK